MRPLPAFILSKDRACQLHLLLESFQRNCPGLFAPYVLWTATLPEYERAYCQLSNRDSYGEVCGATTASVVSGHTIWEQECMPLRDHFRYFLDDEEWPGPFAIFTDDCVFYRPTMLTADSIRQALDGETFSFSLRLGLNTTIQDQSIGSRQPPLRAYEEANGIIRWNWKDYFPTHNYGYPFGMDGCIYKKNDIAFLTKLLDFDCFRTLEGNLSGSTWRHRIPGNKLAAPTESVVVNIPANTVQVPPIPSGHHHPLSIEELNERYLAGEVIDLDCLDFSNVEGAHKELPLFFKKYED